MKIPYIRVTARCKKVNIAITQNNLTAEMVQVRPSSAGTSFTPQ
jgi:hypothetical protein